MKNKFHKLKEYFNFTKRERNGTLLLLSIILIIFTANQTMHFFFKDKEYDYTKFDQEVNQFLASLNPIEEDEHLNRLDKYIIARYDTLDLFMFNPNNTSSEQWKKLGMTEKQISTITNYTSKGGTFRVKDDFRKIYGIRTKQFQILKPYINLPNSSSNSYNNSNNYNNKPDNNFTPDSLFEFNPNTASEAQWKMLGMSDKQTATIKNYLSKGGKFYKKEDLSKIYGVSQEQYNTLEPYIIIDNKKNNSEPEKKLSIELNSATKEELTQISGIGDIYAERIIKYRDMLGGYETKEQLKEVDGLEEETYEKIKDQVFVNTNKITKIRLNFTNLYDLKRHPYIEEQTAKAIINYRNKNGAFTNLNQLIDKKIITQEIFNKIKNYITVE